MANSTHLLALRDFLGKLQCVSRRQILERIAIADGARLGKPSVTLRRRAGRARDGLIHDQGVVEQSFLCQLPTPGWHGRIWSSRWNRKPDINSLSKVLSAPLSQNWKKHAGGEESPLYFLAKHKGELERIQDAERSEPTTSRLHLTSIYLIERARSAAVDLSWSLEEPLRFTDREYEIPSPAAKYRDDHGEVLAIVLIPFYWSRADRTQSYIEKMFERLGGIREDYELWIPRHPKAEWPNLAEFRDGEQHDG